MEQPLVYAGLACGLYAAAGFIALRALLAAETAVAQRRQRVALAHAAAALLLQALALDGDLFAGSDWRLDLGNSLSLFLWQCAALVALLSTRRALLHLGLVVWPLSGVAAVLGALPDEAQVVNVGGGWGLRGHILLSMLAYGLLSLAAVQAALLAWQDSALRRHGGSGSLRQLAPLETLETQLFELVAIGFIVLSLALGSGLMFTQDLFAQHLAHKTFLSIAAWGVFAGLLWGRWRYGWRGRKALRGTLIGYGTLVLAYFGSKFVLEILLGKHWT